MVVWGVGCVVCGVSHSGRGGRRGQGGVVVAWVVVVWIVVCGVVCGVPGAAVEVVDAGKEVVWWCLVWCGVAWCV